MGASCRRAVCFFAHNLDELRSAPADAAADAANAAAPVAPSGAAAPRGLSFDLGADGGAAFASAVRAAAARPAPGRASLDTALATTSFGALGPASAAARARGRAAFDSPLDAADRARLALPNLLPAELGFAAVEDAGAAAPSCCGTADGSSSPGATSGAFASSLYASSGSLVGALGSGSSNHSCSWLMAGAGQQRPGSGLSGLGGAQHQQDVRAAVALLERANSANGGAMMDGAAQPPRRAGLDGGARAGTWGAAAGLHAFDAEQQRVLSTLMVQRQFEQLAAAQCEQFAAQRREALDAAAAVHEHAAMAQLAAQQRAAAEEQQQAAATLQALWLQERRAAAAAAAAVAAAQQESDALVALRWGLASQQFAGGAAPGYGDFLGQQPPADQLTPDFLCSLSGQLSMLQVQRS
jgi:hypothetical protein